MAQAVRHMNKNNDGAKPRRPGDLILDRYLKDASEEEREEARDNLRRFAGVLIGIGERVLAEQSSGAREQKLDVDTTPSDGVLESSEKVYRDRTNETDPTQLNLSI